MSDVTQPDDNADEQAAAEAAAANDTVSHPEPRTQEEVDAAQEEQDKLTAETFGPAAYEKFVELEEHGVEVLDEIHGTESEDTGSAYPDNPVPEAQGEGGDEEGADDTPTEANTKAEIVEWLLDNGSEESESALNAKTKGELLDLVDEA